MESKIEKIVHMMEAVVRTIILSRAEYATRSDVKSGQSLTFVDNTKNDGSHVLRDSYSWLYREVGSIWPTGAHR